MNNKFKNQLIHKLYNELGKQLSTELYDLIIKQLFVPLNYNIRYLL